MQDTLISEERLRALLEPLRNGPVPGLDTLSRAATPSARANRSRWPAAVCAAVVLLAAAAAGYQFVTPYGDSSSPPICDGAEVASGSAQTRRLDPHDLPATLLLGWPDESGTAPTAAYAREDAWSCALAPSLRLIALTGSEVTATIDLSAFGIEPGDSTDTQGSSSPQRYGSRVVASRSPGDGFVYSLEADGVTVSDVESLLGFAVLHHGEWTIEGWPGGSGFDLVQTTGVDADGLTRWWQIDNAGSDPDSRPALSLEVVESRDPLLLSASVGDRLVAVAGQPALRHPDGSVTWKPDPGARATLSGEPRPAVLLALAADVKPLDPDDPRLAAIAR